MSKTKTVVIIERDGQKEVFANLADACRSRVEYVYNTARVKKFPFKYLGWTFEKLIINK